MPKTATPRKPETLERRLAETRNTSRNRSLAALLGIEDRNPLKDMLSAANDVVGRGTIAGFLGLPGDLGGMAENGVRYALGMPQVTPYGGSEHIGQQMEKAGLVTAKRRPVAETLASLISPSAAATAVFKAPSAARAGVRMLDNAVARNTIGRGFANSQVGAIENLWHGSPHTFDRFDLSKIGTGEGAQAYGHGAYLAESPDVARSYQRNLSVDHPLERQINNFYESRLAIPNITPDEAARRTAEWAEKNPQLGPEYAARVDEILGRGNLYRNQLRWPDPAREAADPLSSDHFLHWDKPLSEQPYAMERLRDSEYLNEQLKAGGFSPSDIDSGLFEGRHLVSAKRTGIADESEAMRQLGIPGIRYLDGGSRGAGAGSHNYVVFDDSLIDIVSRNGQPVRK